MPLVDIEATVKIDIGEDWYLLRNELGFYAETIMLVDAIGPEELESFQLVDKNKGIVKSKRTPGEIVAQRNLVKVQAYLIKWSHKEPLTLENIKCISTADSKIIREKIEELESSTPEPFQNESTDTVSE